MTNFIDYFLCGISSGAIIALMALALVLVWRSTRVVNFAQIGQATFTTYIALTIRDATGNWLVALVVAMIAGFFFGILVHFLVIRAVKRLDTSGAIIATFGVFIAVEAFVAMVWGGESKNFPPPISNSGYELFGRVWPFSPYDLLVLVSVVVLVLFLTVILTRTSLGLAMRASAFNPEVARLSGVPVSRMLILGWAIAGLVGAVAGVLVAPFTGLSPTGFDVFLVFAFTAAVIGGLDSLVGAVAFGIGTGLVISLVSGYTDSSNAPLVALLLLVLNLIFKPEGVFSHHKARAV